MSPGDGCNAPNPFFLMKQGSKELVIALDYGGRNLNVTLLNIKKNNEGNNDFEVL